MRYDAYGEAYESDDDPPDKECFSCDRIIKFDEILEPVKWYHDGYHFTCRYCWTGPRSTMCSVCTTPQMCTEHSDGSFYCAYCTAAGSGEARNDQSSGWCDTCGEVWTDTYDDEGWLCSECCDEPEAADDSYNEDCTTTWSGEARDDQEGGWCDTCGETWTHGYDDEGWICSECFDEPEAADNSSNMDEASNAERNQRDKQTLIDAFPQHCGFHLFNHHTRGRPLADGCKYGNADGSGCSKGLHSRPPDFDARLARLRLEVFAKK